MLATGERPRELRWYHAGPMLFGDWGTSRLYVLGLAFAFTQRSSFWFIAAMCALMIGVGWSYEIICRLFPDGGGVYSSARHRSQLLAVVGGLLLCADYVVTASMSCLDAFHYLGVHELKFLGLPVDAMLTALTILAIGGLNFFGPTKTGTVAMVVALATVALTLVIGVFCLPHLPSMQVHSPFERGLWHSWVGFTEIVLALSGVEAIANMTGIMVQPVEKTARKAIVPVLIEIVILNLILAAAMNALPDSILNETDSTGALKHTGDMLKVIAAHYVGPVFAATSSIVFAMLLLSAVNTALADLVSIQFMLSRDKELPHAFSGLNRFGMPVLPLIVGTIIPAIVVLIFPDVEKLAGLYAIGVVGAISINLGTTSTNPALELKRWERAFMFGLTLIMIAIGLTICVVKPHARSFALLVLVAGLAGRLATIAANRAVPIPRRGRTTLLTVAALAVVVELALAIFVGESQHTLFRIGTYPFVVADLGFFLMLGVAFGIGYVSYRTQSYRRGPDRHRAAAPGEVPSVAPKRPLMIQTGTYTPKEADHGPHPGQPEASRFRDERVQEPPGRARHPVRAPPRRHPAGGSGTGTMKLDEDEQATSLFDRLRAQAKEAGVPLRLLYGVARDVPDAILDMAMTHGADLLLLGTTRRGSLWRAMKGDVIQAVAEQLPESVVLLIHA